MLMRCTISQRLLFEILIRKRTKISQHRHILDALVLADTEKIRSRSAYPFTRYPKTFFYAKLQDGQYYYRYLKISIIFQVLKVIFIRRTKLR